MIISPLFTDVHIRYKQHNAVGDKMQGKIAGAFRLNKAGSRLIKKAYDEIDEINNGSEEPDLASFLLLIIGQFFICQRLRVFLLLPSP
jgi:spore maturation protein SpmA